MGISSRYAYFKKTRKMKIENKFPTKDISDEDIATKFPLVAKKKRFT